MNNDSINAPVFLNMNAPTHEPFRIQAFPSAIFELIHVGFRMTPKVQLHKRSTWIQELITRHPKTAKALLSFWDDSIYAGVELALVAANYGYIRDTDVDRFLEALPELIPQIYLTTMKGVPAEDMQSKEDHQALEVIYARIARLTDKDVLNVYINLWKQVWAEMKPLWEQEGLALSQQEADRVNQALANNQQILDIIPKKHMAQLEHHDQNIRKYQQTGYVMVSPLYFISVGGHSLFMDDSFFIGYGINTERAHEEILATSQRLAQQVKALADPTRLMILALISEFKHTITVGDLARRFGVSQPTISGHLRILRESELVTVERSGNRAYYSTDIQKVDELMVGIESLVIPAKDMGIRRR